MVRGRKPYLQEFLHPGLTASAARLLPESTLFAPSKTTESLDCRQIARTGATGLEPATSGVTGRDGHDGTAGCDPELLIRAGISPFGELAATGYDRVRPGRPVWQVCGARDVAIGN